MKKFYSILALAFMCMVGTISAETLTLTAVTNRNDNPSISDGIVTFTLNNVTFEEEGGFFSSHWEPIYKVAKRSDAYLNWELSDPSKTIKIQSVTFHGRSELNGNYMSAETNYHPREFIVLYNQFMDFGAWYTTAVSGDYLFGPSEDLTGGEIHLVEHTRNSIIGQVFDLGGAQLQWITINYTIVEKAAIQTVYATPENEVVFGGDWNEGEISQKLEEAIAIRGGDSDDDVLNPDDVAIVDITGVTTEFNGNDPIVTPNPNTLIEANEGQYNGNNNVIVKGVINNLIVVDPLWMGGHPQNGAAYDSKCTWNLKREGLTAAKASYKRPMTYRYATVAIPFDYNTSDVNAQVEDMDLSTIDEGYITTNKIEADGVAAGQAVLVWAKGDIEINAENVSVATAPRTGAILNGTFKEENIGMGQYAIAMDKFWNAGYAERNFMIVKPFRAWFGRPEGVEVNAKSISILSKNATAINNVEAATTIAPAYNLQGVRVAPNAKGFVIVNGKKYFNK